MERHKISFNAVVETEVRIEKEVEIEDDEVLSILFSTSTYNEADHCNEIDEVNEESDDNLNELLLGIVPDELKRNCVSMTFTDIKVTKQQ